MTDVFSHLDALYGHALERLDAIRDQWFEAGRPLIGLGSTGQQVEHLLVKLLRETEVEVAKLGRLVGTWSASGAGSGRGIRDSLGRAPSAGGKRRLSAVKKPAG